MSADNHQMLTECRLEFQDILEHLARLEDLPERHDKIMDTLTEFRIEVKGEIASLRAKSGAWGLIGGAIPVVIGLAYIILKG